MKTKLDSLISSLSASVSVSERIADEIIAKGIDMPENPQRFRLEEARDRFLDAMAWGIYEGNGVITAVERLLRNHVPGAEIEPYRAELIGIIENELAVDPFDGEMPQIEFIVSSNPVKDFILRVCGSDQTEEMIRESEKYVGDIPLRETSAIITNEGATIRAGGETFRIAQTPKQIADISIYVAESEMPNVSNAHIIVRVSEETGWRVADGDTMYWEGLGFRYTLVDTPEIGHSGTTDQPYSVLATAFNSSLVMDQTIQIQVAEAPRDYYDRILSYIFTQIGSDWILLNAELVAQGLANYKYYRPNDEYEDYIYMFESMAGPGGVRQWEENELGWIVGDDNY